MVRNLLMFSCSRSRKVSVKAIYGAVEKDVRDGTSDVDRAVRQILKINILVPFTEEIYRTIYHSRSVDIARSDLLRSDELTQEELVIVKRNWDRLLKMVNIPNQFHFAIDLLVNGIFNASE